MPSELGPLCGLAHIGRNGCRLPSIAVSLRIGRKVCRLLSIAVFLRIPRTNTLSARTKTKNADRHDLHNPPSLPLLPTART